MARHTYDVMVCGAGPAGLALATLLAPQRRVLLVERRAGQGEGPRIGESLPGAAAPLLHRLGVLERFRRGGHRERGPAIAVWDIDTPVWKDAIFDPAGPGWHLDRRGFERMLQRRAQEAGATLVDGCRHIRVDRHQGGWQLDTGSARYSAPVLVDATGRASGIARQLGLRKSANDPLLCLHSFLDSPPGDPDSAMRIQADAQGWWYSVPLPGAKRVLAYHLDSDNPLWHRLKRGAVFLAHARQHPLLAEALTDLAPARMQCRPAGTAMLSVEALASVGDGFLAIGDALYTFDPISSQGLFHSLASAASAANAIVAGSAEALQRHRQEMQAVADQYLAHWHGTYQGPARFGGYPFWQRRQRLPGA
ncbi:NAD(P)/FAD-dependent oxidoreductase [Marinobacterium sedimentorum]|uniref:NAD(P)/FAD-dependent oxidoreductase n=1 Tax=Marinobacterium sedimentorum TaxID=2927804 RepID=UPI0020C6BF5A|nr:tryptophan 7-halogenase [Marinobacterium sedimentorum]MCP8688238.1 tryptophan 7-halogenase [Marinobacterium sedimentorum]